MLQHSAILVKSFAWLLGLERYIGISAVVASDGESRYAALYIVAFAHSAFLQFAQLAYTFIPAPRAAYSQHIPSTRSHA